MRAQNWGEGGRDGHLEGAGETLKSETNIQKEGITMKKVVLLMALVFGVAAIVVAPAGQASGETINVLRL